MRTEGKNSYRSFSFVEREDGAPCHAVAEGEIGGSERLEFTGLFWVLLRIRPKVFD